ncbi:MAG: Methyltransferase type 12 [Acidobacteriaceae bacterium]|nr:Methyltransferase type 12 [Acidobacteriaceae bacterium]
MNSKAHLTGGLTAGAVFDRLAASYDRDFTDSLIGRAQRGCVWKILLKTFKPGDNLLEVNCGTGEDAFFLANHGISVFACDASQQMIARAEQRLALKSPTPPSVFYHLPTERIDELNPTQRFDGVFSNFSGLNCIENLSPVAQALARLVKPGDRLLLCFSTRYCLLEIIYYLLHNQPGKAFRRCKGFSHAILEDQTLSVFYPRIRHIRQSFAPYFRLRSRVGVGVAIPPSYLEPFVRRHPNLFRILCRIERVVSLLPILRTTGDHVLLCFERVPQ